MSVWAPLAAAATLMAVTALIHGTGLAQIWRWHNFLDDQRWSQRKSPNPHLLMIPAVIAVIFLHFIEAGVFAASYWALGAADSAEQALVHSVSAYSTRLPDVDLPGPWRQLAPLQALQGLLLLAWSVAFFVRLAARRGARQIALSGQPCEED